MNNGYRAPIAELRFLLTEVLRASSLARLPAFGELDDATIESVLSEGAKYCETVLAPLNAVGDAVGSQLVDGRVRTPPGFAAAYRQLVDDGWLGLDMPIEYGGQGMPRVVQAAFGEMVDGANLAFGMLPITQRAAVKLFLAHASPALRDAYVADLVSGRAGATISISEAQAGSDVGRIQTMAHPLGDGRYRLSGTKIFISYGDHDFTDQILHMVLARTPNAAPGTRGLCVFLVPKVLAGAAPNNGIAVRRVEHKMGLRASPTCVVEYGDSIGFPLSEEGRGLSAMFAMVNTMRLAVAVQGVAVATAATARATTYAAERLQGGAPQQPPVSIAQHADVRSMLLQMRARTEAHRALTLFTAMQLDLAEHGATEAERAAAQGRAQILLPVCKACGAELGFDIANLAVQIYGGHGYVTDNGVEQYVRDVRVTAIYEGTTGIQALDLLQRKVLADDGARWRALLEEIRAELERGRDPLNEATAAALALLAARSQELQQLRSDRPRDVEAAATAFLRMTGIVFGAWMWCRMLGALSTGHPLAAAKRSAANYYYLYCLPEAMLWHQRSAIGAAVLDQPGAVEAP